MIKIKAIIFDLGKVVFDLSFDRVFSSWAISSKRKMEGIKNKFKFDQLFENFEKSELSAEEFRQKIKTIGLKYNNQDFDNGWCNLYLDTYPDINNLLIQLKSSCRLVALTNTNAIHNTVWPIKYSDTLSHFEKIIISHDMQTRKPERKGYQIVLDYLKCKLEETIFLDDNLDNIQGAKELGINTILVTSTEQMKNDLQKYILIK